MASLSHTTTDHDEIRRWVEKHDGAPATVRDTREGDEPGVLRIDVPGGAGSDRLDEIERGDWFREFDEERLAFVYQQHRADGGDSAFCRLVQR